MTRIEDHPSVLAMLQALAHDPHAISPSAAAGFAERAIGLIEGLLADNARVSASYEALHSEACNLEEKLRLQAAALAKAHEIAEVSECKIAEVYDRVVKARDLLHVSESLAPGAVSKEAFSRIQDVFGLLQEAKYGLGGRTNVAGSIATLRKDVA